ncbi:hypothetical protein BDV19DRAFT_154222 [Aspergillus venezuelensis]
MTILSVGYIGDSTDSRCLMLPCSSANIRSITEGFLSLTYLPARRRSSPFLLFLLCFYLVVATASKLLELTAAEINHQSE